MDWKEDPDLREAINDLVKKNLKRQEILDFMMENYGNYKWSLSTLDRRMRYFEISYIDYSVPIEQITNAIKKELEGPGNLLGYKSINQRLRQKYDIKVPLHLVRNILWKVDPDGVASRNVLSQKRPKKHPFTSKGSMWVVSVDGHDKLCGYQNSTFPLGIYGSMKTFFRKILYLDVLFSNSNPLTIGKLYASMLKKTKCMPVFLRMDKGTETGKMATMHSFLVHQNDMFADPTDSIIYGPSTTNKIERWWRDLHERLGKYFKEQLRMLIHENDYDPSNELDRKMLAFVYIPIVQRECNTFIEMWNTHRIRKQKEVDLPCGIPDHLFSFPEKYDAEFMGMPFNEQDLLEALELSEVSSFDDAFLTHNEMQAFSSIIPDPITIESKHARLAYLMLREASVNNFCPTANN